MFVAVTLLAALTLSPIAGTAAAVVGYLCGMDSVGLMTTFGATAAFVFGAVLAVAGLLAGLFSSADSSTGSGDRSTRA
jgi:hypothetical protein